MNYLELCATIDRMKQEVSSFGASRKRGQSLNGILQLLVAVMLTAFIVGIVLYLGYQLFTTGTINNSNVTTFWNNVATLIINFSNQFGLIGTVLAFAVIIGVIAVLGFAGYSYVKSRGGNQGGTGMG